MKCPHCQTENSEKAKFCRGCGQPLQTEVICDRCQHKNVIGSRFCEQCGRHYVTYQEAYSSYWLPSYIYLLFRAEILAEYI